MFLARRPSSQRIDRFLRESQDLPLSYGPIGIVRAATAARTSTRRPSRSGTASRFRASTSRADGLEAVRHRLGRNVSAAAPSRWDRRGGADPPSRVLVLERLPCSLQRRRPGDVARFGFAYGTLTNHAESGEELFEVFIDPQTDDVMYRIRAISWPQAMLARFGQPIVRALQERFRDHSAAAMKLATRSNGVRA